MAKLRVVQERTVNSTDFEHDLRGLPTDSFLNLSRVDVVLATDHANFSISEEALKDFGVECGDIFDDQGRKLTFFRRAGAASGSHKIDALYLKALGDLVLKHFPKSHLALVTVQNVRTSMRTQGERGLLEEALIEALTPLSFQHGFSVSEEITGWNLTQYQSSEKRHQSEVEKTNVIKFKKTGT